MSCLCELNLSWAIKPQISFKWNNIHISNATFKDLNSIADLTILLNFDCFTVYSVPHPSILDVYFRYARYHMHTTNAFY